jgi:hypothetical protein
MAYLMKKSLKINRRFLNSLTVLTFRIRLVFIHKCKNPICIHKFSTHDNVCNYIIEVLGLSGLFSSRTVLKRHAHHLGYTHPALETTALNG